MIEVSTTDVVEKVLDDSTSIVKLSHIFADLHQDRLTPKQAGEAIANLLYDVRENLLEQRERDAKEERDNHESHPGAA